jgi:AcrR family transcriptional regulator
MPSSNTKSPPPPNDVRTPAGPTGEATRDRIVREATRLFAAQGVRATTVAQIETAVGLRKGSGGVHRYFATKDDLVEAVFTNQRKRADEILAEAQAVPIPNPSDLTEYVSAIGASVLRDAEHAREVSLIMLREAATFPDLVRKNLLANDALAYGAMAEAISAQMLAAGASVESGLDPEALAFLFVGPLVYYKLSDWLTGEPKLGITEDRLLRTWVAVFEPVLRGLLGSATASPTANDARSSTKRNLATTTAKPKR